MDTVKIDKVRVRAFTIPTDRSEADGTLEWNSTTIVITFISCGGVEGIGYSYPDTSAASLINTTLSSVIEGCSCMDIERCRMSMVMKVRNMGQCGISMAAIAAVDKCTLGSESKIIGITTAP